MIKKLEQITLNAWPSLKTVLYDDWILRISDGVTRRANSISPIFGSSINLKTKIDYCERFYLSRNLPVIFKLTPECMPSDLDAILDKSGYLVEAETSVQTVQTRDISFKQNDDVCVRETLKEEWLNRFLEFNGYDKSKKQGYQNIIDHIALRKGFLEIKADGNIVGCGLGVVEDNYVGIFDVVVKTGYRNRGFGKAIIELLVNWGKANGASLAYLQVMTNNSNAMRLYHKIGFKELYKYWYRVKPQTTLAQ